MRFIAMKGFHNPRWVTDVETRIPASMKFPAPLRVSKTSTVALSKKKLLRNSLSHPEATRGQS